MANTAVNSHNVQIELDDETGTQIDVSGNANNVALTETLRAGTYQVFKDPWDYKLPGGRGWKGTLQIFYSIAAAEAFRDIWANWREQANRNARTLTVSIPNSSPGSDEWSGEVIAEGDIEISADRTSDDPMMVELSFGGTGALSRATIV